MWSPDRSELSLAPILGWLGLVVVAGVFVIDGSVGALTGRLTARRGEPVAHSALGALAPAADPQGAAALPGELGDEPADDLALPEAGERGPGRPGEARPDAAALALAEADPAFAAAASAASSAAKSPPLLDPCLDGGVAGAAPAASCQRRALDGFRAALARSRAGDLGRPLRLSVFGDSVVATDELPGRLRRLAAAELGDGGPGFVYAHSPHRFCSHEEITRTSSGAWTTYAVSLTGVRDHLYGFGGATAQTDGGQVTTRIKGEPVTRVAVHYLAQPRGGQLEILRDREAQPLVTIDSRAAEPAASVATAQIAQGAHSILLRARGVVRLFGLVLERERGAVVDNLGIVSVTAKSLTRNDAAHFASQVRARQPDLVLIMIGANEAQWLQGGANEMREYTERYTELLRPIRQGGAACLVISPLDQVEVVDGRIVSRKISTRIVAAQRSAAVAAGCAFFDSLSWMGGPGSAARWRRRGWLGGDYIHMTRKGSEQLGEALFSELFGARKPAPSPRPAEPPAKGESAPK